MEKEKIWKYVTISLAIICISSFIYMVTPGVSGIHVFETTDMPYNDTLSVGEINFNVDSSVKLTIIPTGIGLEQVQDQVTGAVYVSNQLWWSQGVPFDEYKNVNGYQLGIGKHGNPSDPIFLGISHYGGLDDGFYRVVEVPASAIPEEDTLYFVGATFEDEPYNTNRPYLACITDDDHTDSDYWLYGVSENNPCAGTCRIALYNFDSDSWYVPGDMENYDGAFAVYTEEATGGGEAPAISISISSYIQTVGIISLIGACFSGIKYGLVIGWL